MGDSLRSLSEALGPFSASQELSIEQLRDAANQAVAVVSRLPDPLPKEAENLLPVLGAQGIAGMAQTLLDALQAESELEALVAGRFVQRPNSLPEAEPIQALVAALSQWRLGSVAFPAEQEGVGSQTTAKAGRPVRRSPRGLARDFHDGVANAGLQSSKP